MISVDIDNVTQDFQSHWVEQYALWFDREADPTKLGEWDALMSATHFETEAEFWQWFHFANLWDTMPYEPGAQGGLLTLKQLDLPWTFVTARKQGGQPASLRLARRWNAGIKFISSSNKWSAPGVDLWIDDGPEVLEALHAHGKRAIKFAKPWNTDSPATHTANGWGEVIELVKDIRGIK